jgi:predicted nucleic acid-binding protein
VIDASFYLKLVLPEEKSEQVEKLWTSWIQESVDVLAPSLFIYEVSSTLRNKVHRKILAINDAEEIKSQLKNLEMTFIYSEDMLDTAWNIGSQLKLPTLYDCFYMALSKFLHIPLWTADGKLYNIVNKEFPLINLI